MEEDEINNRDSFPTIHNISNNFELREFVDVNKDFLP